MKLKQALQNKNITHIRLPEWNPTSCLELAPYIQENESRGGWHNLIDLGKKIPILALQMNNDSREDWEISEPKSFEEIVNQWEI